MGAMLWKIWLHLSGQRLPTSRGGKLRNLSGVEFIYEPEEMYAAWSTTTGGFAGYGWPPLIGGR
jgi:hypothetical protein